jgi:ABC-type xylose transport system permease subunit
MLHPFSNATRGKTARVLSIAAAFTGGATAAGTFGII